MAWSTRRRVWVALAGLTLAGWWAFALSTGAWDLVRGPADQLRLPAGEQLVWIATLAFAVPAQLLLTLAWGPGPKAVAWSGRRLYGAALLGLLAVHFGVLGAGTVNDDGPAFLFQAKLLAQGAATAAPPPDLVHFDYTFLTVHEGRWFSYLQPGLSLLMVPGVWLGLPALPILLVNAALPPLAAALARRWAGDAAGRWAGVLALTSPWFLVGGATVEPYLPLLVLVGCAWWAVGQMARAEATGLALRWAAVAGLAIGFAVVLRSVEFGLLGLAFGAHQLLRLKGAPARVLLESGALLVGVVPCLGLLLAYNHAVTGDPLQVPMLLPSLVKTDAGFFGFGGAMYNQHDLTTAGRLWGTNAARAAFWLSGAPLTVVPLLLALRTPAGRAAVRPLWPLLAFAALWLAALLPRPLGGIADQGPVYLAPFALLGWVGLAVLRQRWTEGLGKRLPALLGAGVVVGACTWLPFHAAWLGAVAHNTEALTASATQAAQAPALVLVRRHFPSPTGWVFGLPAPSPNLDDAVVFVWATPADRSPQRQQAMSAATGGRTVYWLDAQVPGFEAPSK